jgi:hypothetical protein
MGHVRQELSLTGKKQCQDKNVSPPTNGKDRYLLVVAGVVAMAVVVATALHWELPRRK